MHLLYLCGIVHTLGAEPHFLAIAYMLRNAFDLKRQAEYTKQIPLHT